MTKCKINTNNIHIQLEGEMDESNANEIEQRVLTVLENIHHPILTIDLADVSFIDKEALNCLTKLHLKSISKGGQCYFFAPKKGVQKMLEFSSHFHEFKIRHLPKDKYR